VNRIINLFDEDGSTLQKVRHSVFVKKNNDDELLFPSMGRAFHHYWGDRLIRVCGMSVSELRMRVAAGEHVTVHKDDDVFVFRLHETKQWVGFREWIKI